MIYKICFWSRKIYGIKIEVLRMLSLSALAENGVLNGEGMSDEKQEPQLMALLSELVKQFSDYEPPRLRKDGDIVIPLDAVLKKNRAAHQNFAEAFSEMMRDDLGPKRSSTWVK